MATVLKRKMSVAFDDHDVEVVQSKRSLLNDKSSQKKAPAVRMVKDEQKDVPLADSDDDAVTDDEKEECSKGASADTEVDSDCDDPVEMNAPTWMMEIAGKSIAKNGYAYLPVGYTTKSTTYGKGLLPLLVNVEKNLKTKGPKSVKSLELVADPVAPKKQWGWPYGATNKQLTKKSVRMSVRRWGDGAYRVKRLNEASNVYRKTYQGYVTVQMLFKPSSLPRYGYSFSMFNFTRPLVPPRGSKHKTGNTEPEEVYTRAREFVKSRRHSIIVDRWNPLTLFVVPSQQKKAVVV